MPENPSPVKMNVCNHCGEEFFYSISLEIHHANEHPRRSR